MGKMVVLMAVVVVVAAATVGMAATSQVEIDRAGNYGSWSVAAVTDRMTDKKWYGAIAGGENGNYI